MQVVHFLRSRRFAPLFWTQFFGAFNDNLLKNAFVVMVAVRGLTVFGLPATQVVALAGGVFILPFFLFSATAGQIADALEKAKLIRWIKAVEVPIMILSGLGFYLDSPELILVSLFLMGAQSAFFGPLKYGILPQHLQGEELMVGNGLIESATFLAILLGTLAGGWAVTLQAEFVLVMGLIGISVLGWGTSLRIPKAEPVDSSLSVRIGVVRPTLSILKELRKNSELWRVLVSISWFWCMGAVVLSLIPIYVQDVLRSRAEVITFFLALFSIGIGVGATLAGKFASFARRGAYIRAGSFGMAVFLLDLGWIGNPSLKEVGVGEMVRSSVGLRISMDLLLIAVSGGLYTVPLYTSMQRLALRENVSRMVSANNILNALWMVMGSLGLSFLLGMGSSVPQVFLVCAALQAVIALWISKKTSSEALN